MWEPSDDLFGRRRPRRDVSVPRPNRHSSSPTWEDEERIIKGPAIETFSSGAEHKITGPVMIRNIEKGVLGIADKATGRLYRVSGFEPSDLNDVEMYPTKVSLVVRPKRRVLGGVTAGLISGQVLGKGGITFERQVNGYRITYPITDDRCKSCLDNNWGRYCDRVSMFIGGLRHGQAERYNTRPENLDSEFPRTYTCSHEVVLQRKLTPIT